jgi:hypothetical protein
MKQQLKHILVRQWLLFTAMFIVLFLLAMFFFMFIFEDNSNDKAVRNVADMLAHQNSMVHMPNNFAAFPLHKVPEALADVVERINVNTVNPLGLEFVWNWP